MIHSSKCIIPISHSLYLQISAEIISVCVCLFQCVKKAVIPAMMDLSAPRAPVHTDQYQGMQTHLTTVRVSHLTFYNCYAVSTRIVSVTVKQSTIYVTG